MTDVVIYHNPRCSKSRSTLALIQEQGIEPTIVLYLEQPPGEQALTDILHKLGMQPRALLRRGEQEYKDLGLADTSLDDASLVEAMCEHPRLIERPIVIAGDRAVIGRPPENVLTLLD